MIRLFTSGTHNGLNFSNDQVTDIAMKTKQQGADRIPFVLGHPKNDLPVVGYLPKEGIILYHENDKMSIGFDREQGDFSEESLDALRELGNNKISVRLEKGIIKHIGLVRKAAVAENNQQDFADELTGNYHTNEDFMEKSCGWFPNPFNLFKTDKTKKTMDKEPKEAPIQGGDFAELKSAVEKNSQAIATLTGMLEKQRQEQEKQRQMQTVAADFAAPEFDHLSDEQKQQAIDFCAGLDTEAQTAYKKMLAGLNHKPATPPSGSVTAEFGANGTEERTAEELIREQIKTL